MPPTDNLAAAMPEEDREVTGELRRAFAEVFLRNVDDESEYLLPARTEVRMHRNETGRVRPHLHTSVPIAPDRRRRRRPAAARALGGQDRARRWPASAARCPCRGAASRSS